MPELPVRPRHPQSNKKGGSMDTVDYMARQIDWIMRVLVCGLSEASPGDAEKRRDLMNEARKLLLIDTEK